MTGFDIARFASPYLLLLAGIIPLMVGYYVYRQLQGDAAIRISTIAGVEKVRHTAKYYLRHISFALQCLALLFLIIAIARPQNTEYGSTSTTEGIDIMLAIDISGSMLARDFRPDRMSAAEEAASKFIVDRRNDRIGIVVFAGESFTQSPLTTDKRALQALITNVRSGIIDDGTAIGNGLATSVNRLRESDAESKVIVLLTDGVNNAGQIAPMTAAKIARTYGIRVYTVGIGTQGMAPYPTMDMWGNITFTPVRVEIDEQMLTDIAHMTGGEYFRATDNNSLDEVYEKINELEKTKIETNDFTKYNELYSGLALTALILLIVEFVLRRLVLGRIP